MSHVVLTLCAGCMWPARVDSDSGEFVCLWRGMGGAAYCPYGLLMSARMRSHTCGAAAALEARCVGGMCEVFKEVGGWTTDGPWFRPLIVVRYMCVCVYV